MAERLAFTRVSSDRVRKELAGLSPDQDAAASYGEGIYTAEWTERTYAEILARAERRLALGESVIVDASWTRADHREGAAETARRMEADLVPLRCEPPADASQQRLRTRSRGASDADEDIAGTMAARAQPWPQAIPVNTGGSPSDSVNQAARERAGRSRRGAVGPRDGSGDRGATGRGEATR